MALVVTIAGSASAAPKPPASKPATRPDPWRGVQFARTDFEAIRGLVRRQYIEPVIDHKRAWIGAANSALGRLDPRWEVLPESFINARKGLQEERGRLSGPTLPLTCAGKSVVGLLLHRVPPPPKPRVKSPTSLAERQERKRWLQRRERASRAAWRSQSFGRSRFDCAMAAAVARLGQHGADRKLASARPVKGATIKRDLRRPPADERRLWIAAANGLLQSLDPHSMVISRKAWDDATRKTQDASFEGIGAILSHREGRTLIENPMRGLPAWRAGIRAGDEIVSVDGKPIAGLDLHSVVQRIRGPRNTTVVLGIRRTGAPAMLAVSIKRARVAMPNVSGELLPDHPGIAHVRMNGFVQLSTVDLRAKIRELSKASPGGALRGLILDLRGNGGGLLDQGLEVADMFLPHGRIVGIRGRRGMLTGVDDEVHEARRQPGWDLDLPLVVMVDDSSASASEIVAAALQDNGRALLLGLRTFGKGSVQRLVEASSDYYVKLTMWRYQAPSGRTIQVNGVRPDVEVGPDAKGAMPPGFREEDLASHLSAQPDTRPGPLAPMLSALNACERQQGKAERLVKASQGARIRLDYQLLRAADLVGCVARLQTGR